MSIDTMFASEAAFGLAASLAAGVWAWLKGSQWYAQLRERRSRRAVEIVEAAVEAVYRTYVAEIKRGRADGQLSAPERNRARQLARERAFAIAEKQGLDLVRAIGADLLDLCIARAVQRLKRG